MLIYLLRHGNAADPLPGEDDAARPLTSRGEKRMRQTVRGMRRLKITPEWVVSSPLIRAAETARIVVEGLGLSEERWRQTPLLAPNQDGMALLRQELSPLGPDTSVMLVGHEPYLSQLLSLMTVATQNGLRSELRKGSLAGVECESPLGPGCGRLLFLLQPRHLRKIGE